MWSRPYADLAVVMPTKLGQITANTSATTARSTHRSRHLPRRCPTEFGAEPNTQVCPVCLGLPGSLPVANRAAIEATIRIGLALNCTIAAWCRFARKNYFYPDMPKNFQISQYDEPLCVDGWLDVDVDGETVQVVHTRAEANNLGLREGLDLWVRPVPGSARVPVTDREPVVAELETVG